ncbi:MAG TPA: nitroreductase [Candidatus Cloacimonetes bacterium]|nr:nitroreductase [Candidatus Cloacimonadota bacterium]HEX37713.1 nitroreductase [Candidatus Cloacimonadota bacterium]
MNVFEAIETRKSIRSYATKELDEEKLLRILEAGRLAPSWQNKQCWQFVVVKEKETIHKLALKSGMLSKSNFFIKDAPVVIVACANPSNSGHLNGQYYYLVDVAIAFQQMMLAAWEMGIGSCWLGAFNEKRVKEILEIPKKIKVVALSPFGYPKEKDTLYAKALKTFAGSKKRKELEKIVHWEQW